MSGIIGPLIGLGAQVSGATGTPVSPSPFGPTPPVPATGPIDLSTIGLSPAQLDLLNFAGTEMDTRTRDIYARLGLPGSTMQAQDLSFDALARSAEAAGLITTNEQLALQNAGLATQQNIASGQQATTRNIAAGSQSLTQGNQLLGLINQLGGGINQLASGSVAGAGSALAGV
ncbi:MAG: hypothetical protein C5B60_04490 [Chloroflexi bacterium]|nr:MAG: hypothetical protein C5B60_04490 [Chloroflexota bacterium]